MYIYMYMYSHMYVYICTYLYIYVNEYIKCICIYVYIHIQIHNIYEFVYILSGHDKSFTASFHGASVIFVRFSSRQKMPIFSTTWSA